MITETTYVYIYNQNVEIRYFFILWFLYFTFKTLLSIFLLLKKTFMFN